MIVEKLTPREEEVARLIACNKTNGEIASRLKIQHRTATNHVQNVYRKVGVANRCHAIRRCRIIIERIDLSRQQVTAGQEAL